MNLATLYLKAVAENPEVTFEDCLALLNEELRTQYEEIAAKRVPIHTIPTDGIKRTALLKGMLLGAGEQRHTVNYVLVKVNKIVEKSSPLVVFISKNKVFGCLFEYLMGNPAMDIRAVISKDKDVFIEAYANIPSCMQGSPLIEGYINPESSLSIFVIYNESTPIARCIVNETLKEYSKAYIDAAPILGVSWYEIMTDYLQAKGYSPATRAFYTGAIFNGEEREIFEKLEYDTEETYLIGHFAKVPYLDEDYPANARLGYLGKNTFGCIPNNPNNILKVYDVVCHGCGTVIQTVNNLEEVAEESFRIKDVAGKRIFCTTCSPHHLVLASSLLSHSHVQHKSFTAYNRSTGYWVDHETADMFLYKLNENDYCAIGDIDKYTQSPTGEGTEGNQEVA